MRAHLAAIGCKGQEISRAHLAAIGCNGLMQISRRNITIINNYYYGGRGRGQFQGREGQGQGREG